MNRQQRRAIAKRLEADKRAEERLIEKQNRIDDKLIELWMVCLALAITDVYGYMPTRVEKIMNAFKARLAQLNDRPLESLCRELCEKTGIEFVWHM